MRATITRNEVLWVAPVGLEVTQARICEVGEQRVQRRVARARRADVRQREQRSAKCVAVIHADLAHTESSYGAFFGRYYREVFRNIRAPKGAA